MKEKNKVSYRTEKSKVTGEDLQIMVIENYAPDPSQLGYAESRVQEVYDFGGLDHVSKNLIAKAKKEVAKLRKDLEYHEKLYYTDPDNVEISDYEYDMMMKRLEQLEEWFPQFTKESSPSVRVGFSGSETQAHLESNLENL